MKKLFLTLLSVSTLFACKNEEEKEVVADETPVIETEEIVDETEIEIDPIAHATAAVNWDDVTFYLDPTGGAEAFEGREPADFILITDIHGDHLDAATLGALNLGQTKIIAPQAVKDQLPDSLAQKVVVMNNGETINQNGLSIEAIPMYNLREEAKQFHPKGRGNGYVIEKDGERLYIAGDTEDIPEMRNLENIDIALVPMNLPYTMPVEAAADAVIEFAPEKVYPYHFRGQNGMADTEKFRQLVEEGNPEVEVVMADWYPEAE